MSLKTPMAARRVAQDLLRYHEMRAEKFKKIRATIYAIDPAEDAAKQLVIFHESMVAAFKQALTVYDQEPKAEAHLKSVARMALGGEQ